MTLQLFLQPQIWLKKLMKGKMIFYVYSCFYQFCCSFLPEVSSCFIIFFSFGELLWGILSLRVDLLATHSFSFSYIWEYLYFLFVSVGYFWWIWDLQLAWIFLHLKNIVFLPPAFHVFRCEICLLTWCFLGEVMYHFSLVVFKNFFLCL